ncbi:TonB-dependent receptor plug domain-containing protein [Gloeobacter violaceus]|nr:TonB-dependent receptor [Gloeobacter violaceus]
MSVRIRTKIGTYALFVLAGFQLVGGLASAQIIPTRDSLAKPSQAARDLLAAPTVGPIAQVPSTPQPDAADPDGATTLDETLVEGRLAPRRSTPVFTITREDIQKKAAVNLADALRGVPGFAINDAGRGADFHNGSYYRGATVNQSALLINGRQIKTGLNSNHGATDYNSIPVEGIKRIELLGPGAGTTLYGSDVIGGVINIITEEGPAVPTFSGSAEYGSYGESIYRTSYGGTSERLKYNFGYQSYGATNNFPVPVGSTNRGEDGRLMNADMYTASYQGSATYTFDRRNNLTFDLFKNLSRKGLIIGNSKDRLDRDGLNVGLTWRTLLGEGNDSVLVTTLGYVDDFFSTYGPVQTDYFKAVQLASKFYQARIDHTWRTSPGNTLRWGVDTRHNTLLSTQNNTSPDPIFFGLGGTTDTAITNTGIFALDTWQIVEGLQLDLGLRQTFDSKFGSYLNPSAGLRWQIIPEVALRASYASVQRNPGPDFLFLPDAAEGFLPNPDLKPERGSVYNAGFDLRFADNLRGEVTYFGSLIQDRIGNGPLPADPTLTQRTNIGAVGTNGVEAGIKWQIDPQWSSYLSYTYTKIKIEEGRSLGLLRFLPESVGQVGVGYDNQGLQVNVFVNYNSGAARTNALTSYTTPFATIDLRAAIPINRALALTVYLANLADVQYERVNTFYSPGLTYRVGLQTSF